MKIVVISGSYFPYLEPPTACIKPFLLTLVQENNDIDLICPMSDNKVQSTLNVDGINVHFISTFDNRFALLAKESKHKIFKYLYQLYFVLKYFIYIFNPFSASKKTINAFYKKLNEIIEQKTSIDFLVSVSYPMEAHLAALKFHKNHPDIKWITFTTDPFGYSEIKKYWLGQRSKSIALEGAVFKNADHNVVIEELVLNLVDNYKIDNDKIASFPYTISDLFKKRVTNLNKTSVNKKITVLYAGTCYSKIRNPQILFDIFNSLPNIQLNMYVGGGDWVCRRMLRKVIHNDNILINKKVSRNDYLNLIEKSDILINIGNTVKLQAPSKLMELVSSGKPIINFYYNEDFGYGVIKKYPLGINLSYKEPIDGISKIVESFCVENVGKRIDFETIEALYPEHLLCNQMVKFRKLLNIL